MQNRMSDLRAKIILEHLETVNIFLYKTTRNLVCIGRTKLIIRNICKMLTFAVLAKWMIVFVPYVDSTFCERAIVEELLTTILYFCCFRAIPFRNRSSQKQRAPFLLELHCFL